MKKRFMTFVCLTLMVATAASSTASAAVIGSSQALATARAADDRAQIMQMAGRADVAAALESYGLSPDEARARIAALSDDEVSRLKGKIDGLPAGQGTLGSIVAAILIIALVLLVTDLLGETDFYSFDN